MSYKEYVSRSVYVPAPLVVKNMPANVEDIGLILGRGRYHMQ